MYQEPFTFDTGYTERVVGAYQQLMGAWLDGLDRQRRLHADIVRDFYASQVDNARTLSEATDTADFAERLLTFATPASLKMAEVSARFGEIAADTQRQIVECLGSHIEELNAMVSASDPGINASPRTAVRKGTQPGAGR